MGRIARQGAKGAAMTRIILVTRARRLAGVANGFADAPSCRCRIVVAARTLDVLEKGREEVLADERSASLKRSLSTKQPYYLNPPNL